VFVVKFVKTIMKPYVEFRTNAETDYENKLVFVEERNVPWILRCKHDRQWDLVIRTVFEPNNYFIRPYVYESR